MKRSGRATDMKHILWFVLLSGCATTPMKLENFGEGEQFEKNREMAQQRSNALRGSILPAQSESLCLKDNWEEEFEKLKAEISNESQAQPLKLAQFADCLAISGKLPEALFYYDLSISNAGKDKILQSKIYSNMANMYLYREFPTLAENNLVKAIGLDKNNDAARYKLSLILFKKSDYNASLSHLEPLKRRYPKDENVLSAVAANLFQLRNFNRLSTNILPDYDDKSNAYWLFYRLVNDAESGRKPALKGDSSEEFNNGFLEELKVKIKPGLSKDGEEENS